MCIPNDLFLDIIIIIITIIISVYSSAKVLTWLRCEWVLNNMALQRPIEADSIWLILVVVPAGQN